MSRLSLAFLSATIGGAVLLAQVPSLAAPTCTTPGTEAACGFRVVPEPLQSTTFIQHDLEYEPVLEAIEAVAPDIIDVVSLGEAIGQPDLRSAGGRQIWLVRVTDESVPADGKKQVVASLSVHANETAGREGGLRYLEDLARWWEAGDTEHQLYSGDNAMSLADVLAGTELWLALLNPDGWAAGDLTSQPPLYNRGNDNGADLNREFPTIGWTKLENTQLSEPEAIGFVEFIDSLPALTIASDIHGELTTNTGSFADMMWPAGEWTPKEQAQELQLAKNMTATIERKFADDLVVWTALLDPTVGDNADGAGVATSPAQFATAYDIVGYDDSGFMGDFFASRGAIEIDVENFLSHTVPNNVWFGPLEQGHVAAVRGIIESMIVEAHVTHLAEPDLDIGNVAYVLDPDTVSSTDEDDIGNYAEAFDGSEPLDYDVTRMRYFEDLGDHLGRDLPALSAADIAAGTVDLTAYDSVVVDDDPFPADASGRTYDQAAYAAALQAYAEQGGQLVLTDAAITLLSTMGLVDEGDLQFGTSEAGHVEFGEITHPWEENLEGLPAQTYYEVPLGYRSGNGIAEAPHHGVTTEVWDAAGGTTVGTSLDFTTLGELPVGDGSVAIFGAILPTQTEENPHVYGLANYAVTVNGGIVLHEILSYRAPNAAPVGEASPAPAPEPTPQPEPAPLPATGGGLALLGLVGIGAATLARRR